VLRATVTGRDAFRVTQRPLVLVVAGRRWPLEALEVNGDQVTGRVQAGR
jgi:hypothetical protein